MLRLCHDFSVALATVYALYNVGKLSRGFLAVRVALLACCFVLAVLELSGPTVLNRLLHGNWPVISRPKPGRFAEKFAPVLVSFSELGPVQTPYPSPAGGQVAVGVASLLYMAPEIMESSRKS